MSLEDKSFEVVVVVHFLIENFTSQTLHLVIST